MKVSLILSTYNGEKYIEEQLDSLYKQTRALDNVLILDDKSTDTTVEIVKEFVKKNQIGNWTIKVNEENQGWKKNFWFGLRESQGDIVFLCDQDDVWDYRKVELMVNEMENNPNIYLLASGFEALYEDGNIQKVSPTILSGMKNEGTVYKMEFTPSFMYVLRPGCTYAIRAELWKQCDAYWHEDIPHDAMLWRHALLIDGLFIIDRNLIQWRRFNTNSSNPYRHQGKYQNKYLMFYNDIKDNVVKHDVVYIEQLLKYVEEHKDQFEKNVYQIVKESFKYQKLLEKAFEKRSLINMGIAIFKYKKYFYSIRTCVKYGILVLIAKIYGI